MSRWRSVAVASIGLLSGTLLGCVFRGLFKYPLIHLSPLGMDVMTIGFLAGVPAAMGYLSVTEYLRAIPEDRIRWYAWLFLPWAAVLLTMAISLAIGWEGKICILFATPIMLLASLNSEAAFRAD